VLPFLLLLFSSKLLNLFATVATSLSFSFTILLAIVEFQHLAQLILKANLAIVLNIAMERSI